MREKTEELHEKIEAEQEELVEEDQEQEESAQPIQNNDEENHVEVQEEDTVLAEEPESLDQQAAEEMAVEDSQVEEVLEESTVVEAQPEFSIPDEEVELEHSEISEDQPEVPDTVIEELEESATEEVVEEPEKTDETEMTQVLPTEFETEEEDRLTVTEKTKKMEKGLEKTRKTFGQRMNELFAKFRSVDEEFFEELEESLIGADVGFETSMKIADALREEVKLKNLKKRPEVQNAIIEKLVDLYEEEGLEEDNHIHIQPNGLTVMLFVGVNGVGKTTSIGKLAYQYRLEGKKVLMAAADTFRAGAIDQLVVWGERAGVEVVRGKAGGDPAAVVYDAIEQAKAQNADILLVDTAGRLQNKVNLMNELEKIKRVIQKEIPDGPHEVLLVVDATTGQNAMIQAKQFKETTDVSGLVLTKLDGTAKGGIVLAIRNELHLPVKLVGLGEGIDDLQEFEPNEFVYGLFKELIEDES